MKSLCSTQQHVCNCFIFTYVSICKKKQQKTKHHPGSCHTTMTPGTKALLHPSCEPNYHPRDQHGASSEVRGHGRARASSYSGLLCALPDPHHLSFGAKDALRVMMSFSLSLAMLHLRHLGKRPGGRGPSWQPNLPQSLWSGAAGITTHQ